MNSSIKTILVIGGTSGIGESFARRWHSMGKTVIITGRRKERLEELEKSLPGLRSYAMDNTDLAALPIHVEKLFESFPDIDTVWINSGKGYMSSIRDLSTSSDANVVDEITTNLTGPMILARHVIPRLLAKDSETHFMITGSGLGFVPSGHFPVYCPTKAFIHQFMVGIRQSLQGTKVRVVEVVPPFVTTDMHAAYKENLKGLTAMSMDDFTNEIFETFDTARAEDLKEVAGGMAVGRVQAWRSSIGKILEDTKMGG